MHYLSFRGFLLTRLLPCRSESLFCRNAIAKTLTMATLLYGVSEDRLLYSIMTIQARVRGKIRLLHAVLACHFSCEHVKSVLLPGFLDRRKYRSEILRRKLRRSAKKAIIASKLRSEKLGQTTPDTYDETETRWDSMLSPRKRWLTRRKIWRCASPEPCSKERSNWPKSNSTVTATDASQRFFPLPLFCAIAECLRCKAKSQR